MRQSVQFDHGIGVFELGKNWSLQKLDRLIATNQGLCVEERMIHICKAFAGTPFYFESRLPVLENGKLRIRTESFDCITFIYNTIALCLASDLSSYAKYLKMIRYNINSPSDLICSDPDTGNIFDFPTESLLRNAEKKGFLENITKSVASNVELVKISVELKRFRRPPVHDSEECFVTPRLGQRVETEVFIPTEKLSAVDLSKVKTGDLILFSRGAVDSSGIKCQTLIRHLAIAHVEDGEVYFVHSTRHFAWRPDATSDTPGDFTNIFYDPDHKKEQIGVGSPGIFAGLEHSVNLGSDRLYGYNQKVRRTLKDYAKANFYGVLFLRIPEAQNGSRRDPKSPCSATAIA